MTYKNRIKEALRRSGFELKRYSPHNSQECATRAMLRHLGIDLVLDVGANTGQYGEELFAGGYSGRVVSFEPLSAAHAELTRRASGESRWAVPSRCAIGAHECESTINVSGNSVSSSLLPMLDAHECIAPESVYIGQEKVAVMRLDDAAAPFLDRARAVFAKIDAQGSEWNVLQGAARTLERAEALQIELALVPLYDGQRPWREVVDFLFARGFRLYFAYPAFTDEHSGQSLQMDAMFVRKRGTDAERHD